MNLDDMSSVKLVNFMGPSKCMYAATLNQLRTVLSDVSSNENTPLAWRKSTALRSNVFLSNIFLY